MLPHPDNYVRLKYNPRMENPQIGSAPPPADTNALEAAVKLLNSGQLAQAAERLRDLLRQDENDEKALFLLGVCHRRSGRHDEALRLQQALVARDTNLAAAYQEIGLSMYQLNRFDEASRAFEQATTKNPDLEISWKMQGDLAIRRNETAAALAAYTRVFEQESGHLFRQRADELLKENNPGLANHLLHHYGQLNPGDGMAQYLMSRIALQVGAATDAIRLLRESLQKSPELNEARYEFVTLLSHRQNYREALFPWAHRATDP